MDIQSTLKSLDNSEVQIEAEITADVFESYRAHALEHLSEGIEIDGFRKGKAPRELVESKIPEMVILEEMANHAVQDAYPTLLAKHKVDAIGEPAVKLLKIAKGNPLQFTINTATMPDVKLPDYKKIATEKGTEIHVEVKDEDVEKTILQIRKMRAPQKEHEHTEGEDHSHDEPAEADLPQLTDEFVKTLGAFENVDDFKKKLRENIALEKEHTLKEKNRLAIIEEILAQSDITVPKILVEYELDKMVHRMKADISTMGLSYDDYLKHLGKSEDAIRTEFEQDAQKRVKIELIIHEIGIKENLKADPEKVLAETKQLMDMYKGADENRTRAYVEMMLTNEAVFEFLEAQKK